MPLFRSKPTYLNLLLVAFVWMIVIHLFGLLSGTHSAGSTGLPPNITGKGLWSGHKALFSSLVRWDAIHYSRIALMGYTENLPAGKAFFPLYPFALKACLFIVALLTNQDVSESIYALVLSGFVLNLIALSIAMWLIGRIALYFCDDQTSVWSALLLLASPWGFYYATLYTESFFLCFTAASFYFAFKNKWVFACIAASMAGAVRFQGIILLPCLIIEYLHQKKWRVSSIQQDAIWLLFVPIGFLAHIFLIAGGPKNYLAIQKIWGWRALVLDFTYPIRNDVSRLASGGGSIETMLILPAIAIAFFLWIYSRKMLRPSLQVYIGLSLVLPLISATTLSSAGRFYSVIFPFYIVGAKFFAHKPFLLFLCIVASAMVLGLCVFLFVNGFWIG